MTVGWTSVLPICGKLPRVGFEPEQNLFVSVCDGKCHILHRQPENVLPGRLLIDNDSISHCYTSYTVRNNLRTPLYIRRFIIIANELMK